MLSMAPITSASVLLLHHKGKSKTAAKQVVQLALFGAQESDALKQLAEVDASQIAPIDAIKLLDELAKKAKDELGQ